MKRIFSILLLLFIVLPLFAGLWKSNELAQRVERIDELQGEGFEREDRENGYILYKDGTLFESKTTLGNTAEIEREGYKESSLFDSEGRLERRVISDGDDSYEYNYLYSSDKLLGLNLSLNGEVIESLRYTYSDSGELLSYLHDDDKAYLSSSHISYIREGEPVLVRALPSGSLVSLSLASEFEIVNEEDGSWSETLGERRVHFSKEGRIISEALGDKLTRYSYDEEGELVAKEVVEGDERTITEYENGEAIRKTEFLNDIIASERRVLEDGRIEETRYDDGAPFFILIYDRDGRRILEVRSL